jgi:ribosomal protein S18 acetylase RimI-like enzyme
MLTLRNADISDHDFLVRIDWKNDGYTVSDDVAMSEQDKEEHRAKIKRFLVDPDRGAFIVQDTDTGEQVGELMFSVANRDAVHPWPTIFHQLNREWFQSDGRFIEIFQLWVHPRYRRQGLATKLKLRLEEEARRREVDMIYTHTEEANGHVIELNQKLGYREVRRGPIWDDVVRISLIKKVPHER